MIYIYNQTSEIVLRSLISLVALIILTRLMGKKQLSHLTFFNYVVGITIGSIAANIITDLSISIIDGIYSLIIYTFIPIFFGLISLKSRIVRKILGGTSTILIQNGKLVKQNLQKTRLDINNVLEECRVKGAFNIADVEFAILETNGNVSVQLKSQKQPITPEDLNISTEYKGLCINLIIDGKIIYESLVYSKLSEEWLIEELRNKTLPRQVKSSLLLYTRQVD